MWEGNKGMVKGTGKCQTMLERWTLNEDTAAGLFLCSFTVWLLQDICEESGCFACPLWGDASRTAEQVKRGQHREANEERADRNVRGKENKYLICDSAVEQMEKWEPTKKENNSFKLTDGKKDKAQTDVSSVVHRNVCSAAAFISSENLEQTFIQTQAPSKPRDTKIGSHTLLLVPFYIL